MKLTANRVLVALGILGWLSVALPWLHDRYLEQPFLTYPGQPFGVSVPLVQQGAEISVHVTRCSSAAVPRLYPVSHRLDATAPGPDVVLQTILATAFPGCKPADLPFVIPKATPLGRYRVRAISEPAGTVKTFSVEWESAEFEVISKETP